MRPAGGSSIDAARRRIIAARPTDPPGSHYRYSDINFEVLGELVERVSDQPLDVYCREHIFAPLGMRDTGFRPAWSERIAPTGRNLVGVVNDPTARRMGGVAGHAGLFSTAADLARFARMLLAGGELDGVRILQPASVEAMSRPQSPDGQPRLRGLGWDVAAPFAADRDRLPPFGAYGHTGYTGTSLWIDPVAKLYVILLSNRVYPDGRGDVRPLRDMVAAALGDALGPLAPAGLAVARPAVVGYVAAPAP